MSEKAQQVAQCRRSTLLLRYILSTLLLAFIMYLYAYIDLMHGFLREKNLALLTLGFFAYIALIVFGQKRALLFFFSQLTVYIVILLIYPILHYYFPELVWHNLPYWMDAGPRLGGLLYFAPCAVFFGAGLALLTQYIQFILKDSRLPLHSRFSREKIEPGKALSLKEILERGKGKQATLRFGEADKGLIARFYAMYRTLCYKADSPQRSPRRILYLIIGATVFIILWVNVFPAYYDTEEHALERDKARMASLIENREYADNYYLAATLRRLLDYYNSKQMLEDKSLPELLSMLGLESMQPLPSTADMSSTGRVIILQFHTQSFLRNNHLNGVYCYLSDDLRSESVEFIADYLPLQ